MRFFTSRWHGGEMPDDANDAVVPAYEEHFATIVDRLPLVLRAFASTINIHDALLRSCRVDYAHGSLQLDLLVGDLQSGYADLQMCYDGISLAPADRVALARIALDSAAEALYDELDVGLDGTFIHRWLWWPYVEFDVEFAGFTYEVTPRRDRSLVRDDQPFLEVPPTAG